MKFAQQGDLLIFKVGRLPEKRKKVLPIGGRLVLAKGEATGHAHAIVDCGDSTLYEAEDGTLYLSVRKTVELKHEERVGDQPCPIELLLVHPDVDDVLGIEGCIQVSLRHNRILCVTPVANVGQSDRSIVQHVHAGKHPDVLIPIPAQGRVTCRHKYRQR